MDSNVGQVEVLGRRIHEVRGGSGRPLLYLHSAIGEALWLPYMDALAAEHELRVPAHPGFLSSQGIDEIHDMEDLVDHYVAYLDALQWPSVDIVGISFGGWIAAEIAARYPARVARLVLVSAVGIWINERPIADFFALDSRYPERFRDLLFHDASCPAAQMIGSPGAEMTDEMMSNVLNAFAATAKIGWNPLLHNPRLERMLRRVTAPTLCLWAQQDRIVPPVYGEKFAALIPNATLQIVPDCGHLIPFEKPDAFVEAVRAFLA